MRGLPVARLDLTRARLTASRTQDLLRVAFLFADLFLEIRPGSLKIRPAGSRYRVLERDIPRGQGTTKQQPETIDTRPTLVVEFPPQHVFEEALFKPAGTDLPEATLPQDKTKFSVPLEKFSEEARELFAEDPVWFNTSPASLIQILEKLDNVRDRAIIRHSYADIKLNLDQEQESDARSFTKLSKALARIYENEHRREPEIADQFIYIGPYGMDPDISALAREEMRKIQSGLVRKLFVDGTLKTADDIAEKLLYKDISDTDQSKLGRLVRRAKLFLREHFGENKTGETDGPDKALQNESAIGSVLPDYAFFS